MERRQVFDLPPITVRVIEHQLIARRCTCGIIACGAAPQGVTAPVQYRPRITAVILYLYVGQFLSKTAHRDRTGRAVRHPVSEGTVATMTKRAADGLDGFLKQVTDRLAVAEVAGFDESRTAGGGRAALGALCPHRHVHPDHLPRQVWPRRHRRCWCAGPVSWCCDARRVGAV